MSLLNKKSLIIFSILLIALIFRDIPYINILSANKVWLAYAFLLMFIILPRKGNSMVYLAIFLLFIAFVLSLLRLTNLAEAFGIIIYFFLWTIAVVKVLSLQEK